MRRNKKALSAVHIIMLSFLSAILLGSLLLSLPISSAGGKAMPYMDALFTATTSVCVTGLVTVPTVSSWSAFGQGVILLLIQIGGLGVITVVAGMMMLLGRKIDLNNRSIISESFNINSLGGIVSFVKRVITFTFAVEAIGALLYMTVFVPIYGAKGIWISVFTSVSAFCNAGLDIIAENSLCDFALNPVVNFTTMALVVFGGIGFFVWFDIMKVIKDRKRKGTRFLSLQSKIVLSVTAFLIIFGAALILIFEYNNPETIGNFSLFEKVMVSLFQSVTLRTAGFATIGQECLTDAAAFVSMLIMFIGGSPGGTAGGIKTVTFFVLIVSVASVIKNKRTADVFHRQISAEVLKRAVAVFAVSFLTVMGAALLLLAFTGGGFMDIMYEAVSATATVGLSRNFTVTLSGMGKAIVALTMYLGRVGPISLAFAFGTNKQQENLIENPVEEISVG